MAQQPDIAAILAALAGARPSPSQTPQGPPPPQGHMPQGPPAYPTATPPAMPGYGLPPAANSGAVDLSGIKPINSGSVSIQDALANARAVAAQKGLHSNPRPGSFDMQSYVTPQPTYNAAAYSEDPRLRGRDYRERSRSRSPPRRENMRDSYNPYREERRGGNNYGRERSNSPRRNQFSPPPQRAYGGGRSRSPPPNDNSEVILIDSSLVGLVIGRQGESLRRIEQESGTRIQFINGPNSGPSRECRITGSPSSRITAKREINRIIEENGGNPARETGHTPHQATRGPSQSEQPPMRAGEESSQIMVPDRTVGLIIGRGGETIRSLQERSKCHVNIVGENKSVNGLRPVNLIGTPEACAEAKDLIMEIVDSDTRAGEAGGAPAHQPQHQPRRDNFNAFGGGPGGGAGGERINDSIMVPSDAVGMIIGKGGETIKDMQATTGCKINVSQASGADIEREIGLVGSRQAIEDAKRAIDEKVNQVKEKNGGGRGGRGGRDQGNNYNDHSYSHQQQSSYGQPAAQAAPQQAAQGDAAAADPYAIYGGYQNYLAMWYSSFQQQGGQPGQAQQPPGA